MYSTHLLIIWGSAILFTILTFYRRDVLLFPLLAGGHWFILAQGVQDIDFVFGDGLNTVRWTADLMDFTGTLALPYFFSGIGIVMFIVGLYHLMVISKEGVDHAFKGTAFDRSNM